MSSVNVSQLILQSREADVDALEQLLSVYRKYLRVTAQIWLPDQLPGKLDASDLVQETLLKAHQRFHQFRGTTEAELTVWLRRILSRCLVDLVRHHQAAARDLSREFSISHKTDDSVDALSGLLIAKGSSPSVHAQQRELAVLLADVLQEMPDRYREVILLRNIKEKPWREIAARMSREIGTVRALWIRALGDLRERMSKYT